MKYSEFEEVDDPREIRHPILREALLRHWQRRAAGDRVGGRHPGRHRPGLVGRVHRLPAQGAGAGAAHVDARPGGWPRRRARSRSTSSGSRSASRTSTSPPTAGSALHVQPGRHASTSSRSSSSAETLHRLRNNFLLFYTGEARSRVRDPRRPGSSAPKRRRDDAAPTWTGRRRSGIESRGAAGGGRPRAATAS